MKRWSYGLLQQKAEKEIFKEIEIGGKGKRIQLCSFTAFLNSFKLMKINLELSR